MQLTCPNCNETIPANNINIQELMAVCPSCHTVFPFTRPNASDDIQKIKRRKVKKPDHLTVHETGDHLSMRFRTNFRLDQDESFIGTMVGVVVGTFVTGIMLSEGVSSDVFLVPIAFALGTLFMYYMLALQLYNYTHIEADTETITISRGPLPVFWREPTQISLSGVVAIHTAETPASVENQYDTPRLRVWAELADGRERLIMTDLTEPYALYVAQRLQAHLEHLDSALVHDAMLADDNRDAHTRLADIMPDDAPADDRLQPRRDIASS